MISLAEQAIAKIFVNTTCSSALLGSEAAAHFIVEHHVNSNRVEATAQAWFSILFLGCQACYGGVATPRGRVGKAFYFGQIIVAANNALIKHTYTAAFQSFSSADFKVPIFDIDAQMLLQAANDVLRYWPELSWGPVRLMQNAKAMLVLNAITGALRGLLALITATIAVGTESESSREDPVEQCEECPCGDRAPNVPFSKLGGSYFNRATESLSDEDYVRRTGRVDPIKEVRDIANCPPRDEPTRTPPTHINNSNPMHDFKGGATFPRDLGTLRDTIARAEAQGAAAGDGLAAARELMGALEKDAAEVAM
eukprot:g2815.t1